MIVRFLALAFFLILATTAKADDLSEKLDRLFKVAKVEEIFRSYEGFLVDGFFENDEFVGDLRPKDLVEIEEKHLAASVLAGDLRKLMDGSLSVPEIDANIEFYDSTLGRKVTFAEANSALADSIESESRGFEILEELERENPERVALILELIAHFKETDAVVKGVMNIMYAVHTLANAHPSNPAPLSEEQLAETVNELGAGLRWEAEPIILATHAFTYRALSNDEFSHYVRFLKTPEGSAFYLAWQEEEIGILSRRLQLMVSDLLDLMQQKRG